MQYVRVNDEFLLLTITNIGSTGVTHVGFTCDSASTTADVAETVVSGGVHTALALCGGVDALCGNLAW